MIDRVILKLQQLFYLLTNRKKYNLLEIKANNLTYLPARDLFNLHDTVRKIEEKKIPGLFLEAGCALGGSAIAIAKGKSQSRPFKIYDVFGMIPPPSENDDADVHARFEEIKRGESKGLGGDEYYGYTKDLMNVVTANLEKYGVPPGDNNIELVQGVFEETLVINEPVAFAHVDCDWYSSVKTCTEQIAPQLAIGGKIIFDDYFEWSGCRKAVDEYFENRESEYEIKTIGKKLHVERLS